MNDKPILIEMRIGEAVFEELVVPIENWVMNMSEMISRAPTSVKKITIELRLRPKEVDREALASILQKIVKPGPNHGEFTICNSARYGGFSEAEYQALLDARGEE